MATVFIQLRTNSLRTNISNVDITLMDGSDSRLNRFSVLSRIPAGSVSDFFPIADIDNLKNDTVYTCVVRLFLNSEPHIRTTTLSIRTGGKCTGIWPFRRCTSDRTVVSAVIAV